MSRINLNTSDIGVSLTRANMNAIIDNFKSIQNCLNDNYTNYNNHKTKDNGAHTTNQINVTSSYTLQKNLEWLQETIDNLVIGANGDGVAETKQARVSFFDNKAFETVNSRLFSDFKFASDRLHELDENLNKYITNVKLFGAIGDGVNDDTEIIQSLLLSNKTELFIPNGTYAIKKNLYVPANTTITFESKDAIFKRMSSDVNYLFINYEDGVPHKNYDGNGNINIFGGTIDINGAEFPTVCSAVMLRHADNCHFKDMLVLDTVNGHAFDVNGCRNIYFDNVECLGWREVTVDKSLIAQEAFQLSVASEDVYDIAVQNAYSNREIYFNNCRTGNSKTAGSVAYNVAIGNHSAYTVPNGVNIYITNCQFDGGNYYAIRLFGFKNVFVRGLKVNDYLGLTALHSSAGFTYNPDLTKNYSVDMTSENIHFKDVDFYSKKTNTDRQAILIVGSTSEEGIRLNYSRKISFNNVRMNGTYERTTNLAYIRDAISVMFDNFTAYDFLAGIRGTRNEFISFSRISLDHISTEAVYFTDTKFSEITTSSFVNCAIDNSNGVVSFSNGCANNTISGSNIRLGGLGNQKYGVVMTTDTHHCHSFNNFLEGMIGAAATSGSKCYNGSLFYEGSKMYVGLVVNGMFQLQEITA